MSDDSILISKILEGDADSFKELVGRYWPMAYQLCYQWTRNHADAEDTAQEAFIKVYKYLGQLNDKSKFASWFYRLVSQLINERWRQKHIKTQQIRLELEDKPATDPIDKLLLMESLNALSDDFRLILMLRFYRGMSCLEIAQHLGEPIGTVTSRLHRAYQALKEKLK